MQNRYVGDIGDFAKYSLLNALSGDDLRLGVVWYLNTEEEQNGDGLFVEYSHLSECDEPLYRKLQTLLANGQRLIAAVENSALLPSGTRFFSEPISGGIERLHWVRSAADAVAGSDIVFFNPGYRACYRHSCPGAPESSQIRTGRRSSALHTTSADFDRLPASIPDWKVLGSVGKALHGPSQARRRGSLGVDISAPLRSDISCGASAKTSSPSAGSGDPIYQVTLGASWTL